ncbi:MAG: rhamnosyltransferase WsaF family glycosyltransferase [Candidatus Limnocylindrales bacterium]
MIRRLRSAARRSGRLVALVRGLRGFVLGPPPKARKRAAKPSPTVAPAPRPIAPVEGVRELIRASIRASDAPGHRVNLIVPAVAQASTFAGIQTALDLFEAVVSAAEHRRIISVEAVGPDDVARLTGYTLVTGPDDPSDGRQIISIATPQVDAIPIRRHDVFVATHWTTAALVMDIRRLQADAFGVAPGRFAYLIQDYEPGFYPWSAQHLLARSTYEDPSSTIAVYHTSLLQDYFHAAGLRLSSEFSFEPRLSPTLRAWLSHEAQPRARRIVVYGRPGKPRNMFPFIVDGLRAWRASTPDAASWSVVSAGQPHPDVDLGDGMWMRSLGKLDLPTYGDLLRTSAIGVSMMASPHPSYPPLEMAQLGMLVLTNRFDHKDLASWHSNIASLSAFSAGSFCADLELLCRRFVEDPTEGDRGVLLHPGFLDSGPQFAFADEIARLLREP